ncbi:MAG: hypothetical protein WAT93_02725 [Pontixanthobacter sp.]
MTKNLIIAASLMMIAASASAQQRPVDQVPQVREVPRYGERGPPREEGPFVLRTFEGKLFMIDQETGCMWSRSSSNFGIDWYYEGPREGFADCQKRLKSVRTSR